MQGAEGSPDVASANEAPHSTLDDQVNVPALYYIYI